MLVNGHGINCSDALTTASLLVALASVLVTPSSLLFLLTPASLLFLLSPTSFLLTPTSFLLALLLKKLTLGE